MKIVKLTVIIFTIFFLTACGIYAEIHEISFVTSIGFSYDKESKLYQITLYLINNANLTSSEYQSSNDVKSYTAAYSSLSITDALYQIKANIDIELELKHIKTIFVHESFINDENINYLYHFFRNGKLFYPTFEIYLTNTPIKKIYEVEVFDETTIFYTLITGIKKAHNHQTVGYYQFVNDYLIDDFYLGYPFVCLNEDIFNKGETPFKTTEIKGLVYFNNLKPLLINYKEYPGLYLIHTFNNLVLKINELELVINNYYFNFKLENDYNATITIKGDIAYIYSKEIDIFNYQDFAKKCFISQISALYAYAVSQNIDIFNINYQRSLKNKEKVDLSTIHLNYEIDLLGP